MHQFFTEKSIFHHWQTPALLGVFFGLRLLSFAVFEHPLAQAVLVFLIVMIFGTLYFYHHDWAWYMLLAEICLGGSGHLFEFFGLSLRTVLIATFILLWLLHSASVLKLHHLAHIRHKIFLLFIPLAFFLLLSIIRGFIHGHSPIFIIQDLIPYAFFFLLLPAYHLFQEEKSREYLIRLVLVFILGSALFSLFVFLYYSSGFGVLQDAFYDWYRNAALGKITDMGSNSFRVVLPEHLLLVPFGILMISLLMRNEKHHKLWYLFLFFILFTLVLNLSRTYALAFVIGLLILAYKHSKLRWMAVSASVGMATILIFTSVFFLASRGSSLGWELFGVRISSIAQPRLEVSSNIRTMLLPPIMELFKTHPLLGSGLGASVTYIDPITFRTIRTTQFDWGYHELLVELGILGTLSYLVIIGLALYEIVKKIKTSPDWHDFYVGLLGAAVAFLVMNVTSPALYHVFGVLFFVLVLTIAMKPHTIFDTLVVLLYRVFNRIKKPYA